MVGAVTKRTECGARGPGMPALPAFHSHFYVNSSRYLMWETFKFFCNF